MQQKDQSYLTELMDLVPHIYRLLFQSVQRPEVSSLPATQLRALFLLQKNGTQSMSVLADALAIPRQQLTKVVHALVGKHLVIRKSNEANRRMIMIEVSPEGKKLMKAIMKENTNQCTAYLNAFSSEEQEILVQAINILNKSLNDSNGSAKKSK